MLYNRLKKNLRRLSPWAQREGVTNLRLYDHDIPELPFIFDRYETEEDGAHLHASETIRFEQPEGWVAAMLKAAAEALEIPEARLHLKQRKRQRGAEQYTRLAAKDQRYTVQEGGLRFLVNFDDYLDTGLFLDHRVLRGRVRGEAEGRSVLNLFAYTGAFTVYAADGGAAETTTVDWSNTYLDWTEDNLLRNDIRGHHHELVRADALEFLEGAARARRRWDIIVLDPPTFSNRKGRAVFDVSRDHRVLIRAALAVLSPGGHLYFSTNALRFRLDETLSTSESIQTTPRDFSKTPHRCWRFSKA
ncbi:class I SAM-dependent methyltransferase [Myxococcota bacterium]|nr:class I SAM-dependent methyltransferase [Myxococcota bacterium]MBU1431025.1 class I SAM-dependent methyltransferase [Myxococcota bacterium]MBU1900481.1 class I SAM-dependent methyltransferase [Myxococcota bacterium]